MSNQTVHVLRTRGYRVIPVAGIYEIDGAHATSSTTPRSTWDRPR
jgi:hypothetical protein